MIKILGDPRFQLSFFLLLIFGSAILSLRDLSFAKGIIFAVPSAIIFDLIFLKIRRVEFFLPTAALTSGLIIALLIAPQNPWYEFVFASFLAVTSKNFLKFSNRHIFNPAGLGILASSVIFNHSVSWWAVSFQQSTFFYFILLSPVLVSIFRLRRYKIILPFLLFYFLFAYALNHSTNFLDPTVLFFATVMLPEPQTTPNRHRLQLVFGIFVAIFAVLFSIALGYLITFSNFFLRLDALIFSLLAGNLIFYRLK